MKDRAFESCAGAKLLFAAVVAASLIPVAGAFTTSRIFHVRDLALFFWPRHLWLRRSLVAGESAFWDPYAGAGQSAAADALNQMFFPIAVALRLLPDVIGFNLWVALPLPVAAAGAYMLFRLRCSPISAAVGALVAALSGPIVSTANFPNLSWAVAFVPWIVWAAARLADRARLEPRRLVVLALLVSLQALAGEPVTLAATGMLTLTFAIFAAHREPPTLRERLRAAGSIALGLVAGALLAAVQLVPLAAAVSRSTSRVTAEVLNGWSVHPLTLIELVVPHLFGDTFHAFYSELPWIAPLNSDREPFLFSVYLGIGALVVAVAGLASGFGRLRRWAAFWSVVALVALAASLGKYTPVYPVAQATLPILESLRFPAKYLVFVVLALAALVTIGLDSLGAQLSTKEGRGRAGECARWAAPACALLVALAAGALAISALALPSSTAEWFSRLGTGVGVEDPNAGARFLLDVTPALCGRLAVLAGATGFLLVLIISRRPQAPVARVLLFVLLPLDLAVTNAGLNPTLPAALISAPAWTRLVPKNPNERVYVGSRVKIPSTRIYLDAAKRAHVDAEYSPIEALTLMHTQYALTPRAWGIREVVSYDLPVLWPREYYAMLRLFSRSSWDERLRFLLRTGVRFCVLPEAPWASAQPIAAWSRPLEIGLYECNPRPRRVLMVARATVEADIDLQVAQLFAPDFDVADKVLVERRPPPAAGRLDTPREPSARIVADTADRIVIRAAAGPDGGYLTLFDSFDPSWNVTVDGARAPLLRANGLFRAVRIASGEHVVEFSYRSSTVQIGLWCTGLTSLVLIAACARPSRAGQLEAPAEPRVYGAHV